MPKQKNRGHDRWIEKEKEKKKKKKQEETHNAHTPESNIPECYTIEDRNEIQSRKYLPKDFTTKNPKEIKEENLKIRRKQVDDQIKKNEQRLFSCIKIDKEESGEKKREALIQEIDIVVNSIKKQFPEKKIDIRLFNTLREVLQNNAAKYMLYSDIYDKIALAILYNIENTYAIELDSIKYDVAKFSQRHMEMEQQDIFIDSILTETEYTGEILIKKLNSGELMDIPEYD